ncbi:MAG: hypothetical protein ABSD88_09830 [Candidatus Korobacteraceae bacterium]|jgi:hypothetical protein
MVRSKRVFLSLIAVAAVAAAIVLLVLARRNAAPEAARLLPECDAVVYLDFRNIHRLTSFSHAPAPKREPEYEEFIRETGFDFERDLREAAMAVHLPKAATGRAAENRYSEVLVGQFNLQRVQDYLKKISHSVETYQGTEVFIIPVEQRQVRVAILGVDRVAISNVDDPEVIHGMIDRAKHLALPVPGPSLLPQYYRQVPLASLAWVIARIPADSRASGSPYAMPGGFDVLLPRGSTVIASIRYLGAVQAKAEFLLENEQRAQQFTSQANAFLELFKSIEANIPRSGSDPDVKAVFDSFKIEQEKDRAVLRASISTAFLKKFFSEPMLTLEPQPRPSEPPAQAGKSKRSRRSKGR